MSPARDGFDNLRRLTRGEQFVKLTGQDLSERDPRAARDAFEALETLIDIGCERVLTSGLMPNVNGGKQLLKELVAKADERIIIMPGSGVRHNNLAELAQFTGAVEFHTSARTTVATGMQYINDQMNEALTSVTVDSNEVIACLAELNKL